MFLEGILALPSIVIDGGGRSKALQEVAIQRRSISSLSVEGSVDAQYNYRRRICRQTEELLSTDEDPSTAVLLQIDRHVDGSCTVRRRVCRQTVGNFVFLLSEVEDKASTIGCIFVAP